MSDDNSSENTGIGIQPQLQLQQRIYFWYKFDDKKSISSYMDWLFSPNHIIQRIQLCDNKENDVDIQATG
jgi:hypothetical protein